MDSPVSSPFILIVIVLGAVALVTLIPVVLERRYARRVARSPRVVAAVPLIASAPALESTAETVSADVVRRIVDPALTPVDVSLAWRPSARAPLPAEILGYDGSREWTRAESDGLVALHHLGTDLASLAAETGVDERVVVEELARRLYGAVDPVIDRTRPRRGAAWTTADRAAIRPVARRDADLSDVARLLGRDQLEVVHQLLLDGRRAAHVEPVG